MTRIIRESWAVCRGRLGVLAGTILFVISCGQANAQGVLVMYCGADESWCRAVTTTYEKETGVKINMVRMSAGETYARIRAEKDNPHGDIWWGGTGDPHLQAADDGLTEPYESPQMPQLRDWAQRQAAIAKHRTVGIYLSALGFGYNKEELARRKLAAPACWADLIRPEFKGEVQMADPNASGTAWTALATIVQLMGEDKAFSYFVALNRNINEYPKTGAAPALSVGQGETLVGIAFQHDIINVARSGKPAQVVSPCEGTGYEIGSMSLIKDAPHMAEAKKFYEWALTPAAQKLAAASGNFQLPSNPETPVPPESPDLSKIKLIEYDFNTYGSKATRNRILARWADEVKNAPR
ncbi:MAG TPA: ABC transporter substrate-binding protein [Telmatospirillum sp.]|nr:ABC transporter substrate-binding protein [Telmatospirillum sp.]